MLTSKFTVNEILLAGDEAVFSNSFEYESLAKEYTVEVKPVGVTDYDESDNSALLAAARNDIAVEEAYFTKEFDKTYLNIMLTNEGTHDLSSAVIRITEQNKNGKEILQTNADRLSAGEAQLYKFDMTSIDAKQVYITAYIQSDADDFNNSAIAYRVDDIQNDDITPEISEITGIPVNQDSIAVTQCTPSDISDLSFNVVGDEEINAAICIVCVDSDDNFIKVFAKLCDIKTGNNTIEFSEISVPGNTASLKLMVWNRKNLKPLIKADIYKLSAENTQ